MGYVRTGRRAWASGKRKYRRFKKWSNTPQTPKALALQALRQTKYIRGLVNSEMFHLDTTINLGSFQNFIFPLINLAQGDGPNQRTGRSILLRNIVLRGYMAINSSVTSNTRISLVLVKDLQQAGDVTPNMNDIFQDYNDPDTLLNLNTAGRFKLLWRRNYTLTPVGGRNAIDIKRYWKLYDHIKYNGTGSSDIQKNGYYLVVLTSEATNFPTVRFNSRIGYHDN